MLNISPMVTIMFQTCLIIHVVMFCNHVRTLVLQSLCREWLEQGSIAPLARVAHALPLEWFGFVMFWQILNMCLHHHLYISRSKIGSYLSTQVRAQLTWK